MNALPRIVSLDEVQPGDVVTVKYPPNYKRNRVTFRVVQNTDLALTGWGVSLHTGAETHQHKLVSHTSAMLSEITLQKRPS